MCRRTYSSRLPALTSYRDFTSSRRFLPFVEEHRIAGSLPTTLVRTRQTRAVPVPRTPDLCISLHRGVSRGRCDCGFGMKPYEALPGQVCCTPPGRAIESRTDGGQQPYERVVVSLPWSLARQTAEAETQADLPHLGAWFHDHMHDAPQLTRRVNRLWQAAGDGDHTTVDGLTYELVFELVRSAKPGTTTDDGRDRRRYRLAHDFMREHLEQPVALSEIAAAANTTERRLSAIFRAEAGEPPWQHLMRLRVERAKLRLVESGASLAWVAAACGFADQPHLTRVFRRFTGSTPAAWRSAR